MDTLYTKIGPERLRLLVDTFYNIVFAESSIRHLFDIEHTDIREKQFLFLTQFLGGPASYSDRYGHPRMRERHLPHPINVAAKDEWLRCMQEAIRKCDFEPELARALYNCFPAVATHMINS